MKDKNLWLVFLVIVFSLITAIAVAEVVSAADTNDTEDWLVVEPEEKICDEGFEDWLWIPGCNPACTYTSEDNETLNATDEDEDIDIGRCIDIGRIRVRGRDMHIDYFMNNPKAAVAAIAFVNKRERESAKNVFACKNISFGLDETAEQYYAAILQVRNQAGFSKGQYPPSGLTIEQAKKVFYIDTNELALFWLSEENNNLVGRLHYYILIGACHNHERLCPEDAGSAIAVMKSEEGNTSESIIKINRFAYQLAVIAYFYDMELVDQCISNYDDLPTDELEQVEIILERANKPETPSPTPFPTPRPRFDYWQYQSEP